MLISLESLSFVAGVYFDQLIWKGDFNHGSYFHYIQAALSTTETKLIWRPLSVESNT